MTKQTSIKCTCGDGELIFNETASSKQFNFRIYSCNKCHQTYFGHFTYQHPQGMVEILEKDVSSKVLTENSLEPQAFIRKSSEEKI
jgi:ribosomal protein L31